MTQYIHKISDFLVDNKFEQPYSGYNFKETDMRLVVVLFCLTTPFQVSGYQVAVGPGGGNPPTNVVSYMASSLEATRTSTIELIAGNGPPDVHETHVTPHQRQLVSSTSNPYYSVSGNTTISNSGNQYGTTAIVSSGTNVACAIAGNDLFAYSLGNNNVICVRLSNRKVIPGNYPRLEACSVCMQSYMIFIGCPVEIIPSATYSSSVSTASMPGIINGTFTHSRLDGTNNVTISWSFTYLDENAEEQTIEYDPNDPKIPSYTAYYVCDFPEIDSVNGNTETTQYLVEHPVNVSTESNISIISSGVIISSTVSGASCIVTNDTRQ